MPSTPLQVYFKCPWNQRRCHSRSWHRYLNPSPVSETVHNPEITDIQLVMEGWASWKYCGKHPYTLYKCDCGEIITANKIEQDKGLIECYKVGCETRWWVLFDANFEIKYRMLTVHISFTWIVFILTSGYSTGFANCAQQCKSHDLIGRCTSVHEISDPTCKTWGRVLMGMGMGWPGISAWKSG